MRPRTLLVLLIVVAALAAFIRFYERDLPSSEERVKRAKKVLDFKKDQVTRIRLVAGGVGGAGGAAGGGAGGAGGAGGTTVVLERLPPAKAKPAAAKLPAALTATAPEAAALGEWRPPMPPRSTACSTAWPTSRSPAPSTRWCLPRSGSTSRVRWWR